jgi:ribosomal protein L11 methyltransferase
MIMNYLEYNIKIDPFDITSSEIIVALLAECDFDTFVDTETGLLAYIPENFEKETQIVEVFAKLNIPAKVSFTKKIIEQRNWNEVWENNFEPIFIDNTIAVLAPFHTVKDKFNYEIIIEPKMSFGTGHHETTSLMMSQMLNTGFNMKSVLDMGCGTGILAILAEKLGATKIVAIDNDEWAYNNCIENFERNQCKHESVLLGNAHSIPDTTFDIILANINRNILLADINVYAQHLLSNGLLLVSGFYQSDLPMIENECNKHNLLLEKTTVKNQWICTLFIKGS